VEQVLLWPLVIALTLTVSALAVLLYQVIRQQGRLLLRLDALEGPDAGTPAAPTAPPRGLPVGAVVEPFELPAVSGERVSLSDYRGRRVVLVHWSPGCGFCVQIAPELAALEPKLRARDTALVLVSYGDNEPNEALAEEHGLGCPILLQTPGQQLPAFQGLGTPVAYLLDEEARVAAPVAIGAIQVPELVRAAAEGRRRLATERSLSESRLEREGVKPGTRAPTFELEDVRGGNVSLHDYRGRRILLVFSDPDCGPCNALLPDLARLQHEATVVVVSRGDRDLSRAKAEEHGLEFPVLVQAGWTLSKQYGIFATPVAFLIDEQGVVARDVAKGRDEIVALARQTSVRREAPVAH
jgi:peroxiredoxin